jgi:hypothetical protein
MSQGAATPLMLKLRDRKLPRPLVERLERQRVELDAGDLLMYLKLIEHHLIQHYEEVLFDGKIRENGELRVALSQLDADCDQFLRGLGENPEHRSIPWWRLRSVLWFIALEEGLTGDIRRRSPPQSLAEAIQAVLLQLRLLEGYLDRFYDSDSPAKAAKYLLDVYGTVLELHPMCVELTYRSS